jgi:hypothetical protein
VTRGRIYDEIKPEPKGKADGFPDGSGSLSLYIPTRVTIQTFSITTPALSFLEINIGRVDSPYCSNSWAIRENIAHTRELNFNIIMFSN